MNLGSSILALLSLMLTTSAEPQDGLASELDGIVQQYHTEGQFNGVVLVAGGKEVLYSSALGKADISKGIPVEQDTQFRIASITKGMTAVLALQAVERGELDLDGRINKYLPGLSNRRLSGVTIRHLLTNSSGIPDFAPKPLRKGQNVYDALVERLNNAELVSDPGEQYVYCNVGYTILGFILEHATEIKYSELLEKRIFLPLEMKDSRLGMPAEGEGDNETPAAIGYEMHRGQLRAAEEVDLNLVPAAGGVVSTSADVLRFSRGLSGGALIEETSSKQMLGLRGSVQFGCKIIELPTGDKAQIFQGGMPGASSILLRINDGEYSIILLCNQSDVPCQRIAQQLLMVLLKR